MSKVLFVCMFVVAVEEEETTVQIIFAATLLFCDLVVLVICIQPNLTSESTTAIGILTSIRTYC